MSGVDDDPMPAAGRAWMTGELSSEAYFSRVRREALRDRWAPRGWRRLRGLWAARSVQRG